jgi:hypothetical protein
LNSFLFIFVFFFYFLFIFVPALASPLKVQLVFASLAISLIGYIDLAPLWLVFEFDRLGSLIFPSRFVPIPVEGDTGRIRVFSSIFFDRTDPFGAVRSLPDGLLHVLPITS